MDTQGYLHDELHIKILILYILSKVSAPLSEQDIYALCYQDDSLNYFTFSECLPALITTGQVQKDNSGHYVITENGLSILPMLQENIAVPVVKKVNAAIEDKNRELRAASSIHVSLEQDRIGNWIAGVTYTDGALPMMDLKLLAPDQALGEQMCARLQEDFNTIYRYCMDMVTRDMKQ